MKPLSIQFATFAISCLWQGTQAFENPFECPADGWKCVVADGRVDCSFEMKVGPDFSTDTCQAIVYSRMMAAKKLFFDHYQHIAKDKRVVGTLSASRPNPRRPVVGEFVCYNHARQTGPTVNEDTCKRIAAYYRLSLEEFFKVNPTLDKDCKSIQPNTEYCIQGYVEPLRAWDGLCGPQHKNAVCAGTGKECCNSETWRCGSSDDDCDHGTCYEGSVCPGASVYSIDGKCGSQHGDRKCAGKWGDCCSIDGVCGTGPDFCDISQCQSGACDFGLRTFQKRLLSNRNVPWLRGNTTDGTCGGRHQMKCNVAFGTCCSRHGVCGSSFEYCREGCQPEFGHCFT